MKNLLVGLFVVGSISAFADCKIRFDAQVDNKDVVITIVLDGKPLIKTVYMSDGSYQRFVSISQTETKNDYPLSLVPVPANKIKVPLDTKYVGVLKRSMKVSRNGMLDILEAPVSNGHKYLAKAKFQDDEFSPEQEVLLEVDNFCFRKY